MLLNFCIPGIFVSVNLTGVDLQKAAIDVLAHPTVASKRFLITIGDRTVGGLKLQTTANMPTHHKVSKYI